MVSIRMQEMKERAKLPRLAETLTASSTLFASIEGGFKCVLEQEKRNYQSILEAASKKQITQVELILCLLHRIETLHTMLGKYHSLYAIQQRFFENKLTYLYNNINNWVDFIANLKGADRIPYDISLELAASTLLTTGTDLVRALKEMLQGSPVNPALKFIIQHCQELLSFLYQTRVNLIEVRPEEIRANFSWNRMN